MQLYSCSVMQLNSPIGFWPLAVCCLNTGDGDGNGGVGFVWSCGHAVMRSKYSLWLLAISRWLFVCWMRSGNGNGSMGIELWDV